MKNVLLLLLCINVAGVTAQSISYSHRTTHIVGDDAAVVVPEVGGKNHLWIVTPDEQVKIQVYDHQLDWQQEQVLPVKLPKNSDITILPFEREYFYYNQSQAGRSKFLWHIDSKGNLTDVSSKLRAIIKLYFNDTTVVCQLFSKGSRMYMLGNVYFPSIKKIITTLIQTNLALDQSQVKRFAFDYDHRGETLQRMMITPENKLLVLKERSSEEVAQILNVLKIDLVTSKVNAAVFTSNTRFTMPELVYNPADSTTTLCGYRRSLVFPGIFFSTLDDTLAQKLAPVTLRVPISSEMYGAFAAVSTGTGGCTWLPVYGSWNSIYEYRLPSQRVLIGLSSMVTLAGKKTLIMNASSYQPTIQAIHPYLQNVSPPGDVRFSVINLKERHIKDTVFKYYRKFFIEVGQYASFTRNNNGYLLLKEQFRSNGKGIVLLNTKEGKLVSSLIRVYERNHYAIPQMRQTANGSLVIPYVYKNEVGLVKITLAPDQ